MDVFDYLTRIANADTRNSQLNALNSFINDFATASSFGRLTTESSLVAQVRLKIIANLENIHDDNSNLNFEWLSILRILSRDNNVACQLLDGQDGRGLVTCVAHNALYVDEDVVREALGIREAETLIRCRLEAQKVLNNCMLQVPYTAAVFLDLPGSANALLRFVQFSSPNVPVPRDLGISAAGLEANDVNGSCQKGASPNIISSLDDTDKVTADCETEQYNSENNSGDIVKNECKFSNSEGNVYSRLADVNTRIYDLTILVLVSLLEKEGAALLYERYDLFGLLLKLLDNEMTVLIPNGAKDTSADQSLGCCKHFAIPKETALLFEQILKALYNVGSHFRKQYPDPNCLNGLLAQRCAAANSPNSLDSNFSNAAQLSRKLLFAHTMEVGHKSVLHPIIGHHVINMLLCCPPSLGTGVLVGPDPQTQLDAPKENTQQESNESIGYQSSKLVSLLLLVRYLEEQLAEDTGGRDVKGRLMPVVVLLTSLATHSKVARRYLRSKILPPLKDVHMRPEDARDLRGRMVTLMTAPTDIKNYAALLLYVLCKQNVDRLVKYTGFGNAAGMLADFHLLGAMKLQSQTSRASTDSEDSDTEEYRQALPDINPVIGCVDPPEKRTNPFEGMTEEQKEYEAVKLMNDLSKLMDQGIRPGRITEDGGMQPIEHVLELPNAVGAGDAVQRRRQSDESSED